MPPAWTDPDADRLEIGIDRTRLAWIAALVGFIGLAFLVLCDPWSRRWLAGGANLALVPLLLWLRDDRRPLLILDRHGFCAPRNRLGTVAWADVRRVRLTRLRLNTLLRVEMDPERLDAYLRRRPRIWRSFPLTLMVGRLGNELQIDLTLSEVAPEDVLGEMIRHCQEQGRIWP